MIVVIGLGNIGLGIGRRLVMREQDVCGVDLSDARRSAWKALTGLDAAASLDDVDWERATTVFVIVRLTEQAESVLTDISARDRSSPLTVYVATTLAPDFARDLDRFNGTQVRIIELPVSGGELGALAGDLVVMPAGPITDDDRKFLTATIAAKVVDFPKYGDATLAKLVNNVLAAYNARALADMVKLSVELGLDPAAVYEVVVDASAGTWMTTRFFELIVDLLEKDVELLRDRVGELPEISLAADADLDAALADARSSISDAAARPAGP